jgi:hypothetical protein
MPRKGQYKPKVKHARACIVCGETFVTNRDEHKCCSRRCSDIHWRSTNPPRLITVAQVRREDGLDKPKMQHVCRAYPPSGRCVCGKLAAAAGMGG